ncbi:hypothetical protein QC761_0034560 [Podospora bellae-mahoneyi]|uniref:Uncharacterized protein n=1 Tax=Podospora bellae-mahoneyi TaxID=2093777 RepID=A0ABR0FRN6_9PEZI|nr:hypothetical protein QC761_0034560 [Podospora bellae-mahoneyi]
MAGLCSAVLLFCCSAALSIVLRWHSVEDCPERIRAKVRQFGVRIQQLPNTVRHPSSIHKSRLGPCGTGGDLNQG